MLNKANITWSAKQISNMITKGSINFDSIVQRSLVWKKAQKSSLIESLLLGYPVPAVFAKKTNGNPEVRGSSTYNILDGKQRLNTIKEFLNDEFELVGLDPYVYYSNDMETEIEDDINGMKFSQLPEELQDVIKDTMFSITYFDSLTDREEKEMFRRLNSGTALSSKSKMLASCNDIPTLLEIGKHKLFEEMLTDKQKDNKEQAILIMKIYVMLKKNIEDVTFSGAKFSKVVKETELTQDDVNRLEILFDTIVNIHHIINGNNPEVAKKIYTETHMVSFIPHIAKQIDNNANDEEIAKDIMDFFSNTPDAYLFASSNAVASKTNIKARNEAIEDFFANRESV